MKNILMNRWTGWCLGGLLLCLSACQPAAPRFQIGVAQCSEDTWRSKMNDEILREALFYDGVSVEIRSAGNDSRQQAEDVRYFIEKGVDLLIVSANEAAPMTPIVEEAYRKGIPVITVDRKILSDQYTAYIGADNYEIGRSVGRYLASRLNGKGKIVELTGLAGSTPAMERHRGFCDVIREYPAMELVDSADAAWLQTPAEQALTAILQRQPEVDAVYAHNDRMAAGAYQAAHRLGDERHFLLVGIDALPGKGNGVEQVLQGQLDATFIYPTQGDKVLQLAMDILEKRPFNRETVMHTALVDSTNARIMQLQTSHISDLDGKIEVLNDRIDTYLSRYSAQTLFIYASVAILLLLAALLALIVRAYWTKTQMNAELSAQKKQLEEQRDQLEEQRDQLIRLSQQLEEATQAKLSFFTNVSHDFRTPLTLIADPVEQLLEDRQLADKQRTLLQIVHKQVHILLRLVNQILDFRKYENGKLELLCTPVNVVALLNEWSEGFRALAYKKRVHLSVDTANFPADTWLLLDAEKMERIYFNLLSNAFKFTPENGTVVVTLSSLGSGESSIVRLQVSDTGKGISAEHLQHIFERFYQPEVSHAGSGIGLALVKAFVEMHGGSIRAESVEGSGTNFIVDLPMHLCAEPLPDAAVESANTAPKVVVEEIADVEVEEVMPDEQKACTLLIDDNADVRSYVKSLLADTFTVIEAANGQEGLKKAMKYVPDVIVCDVMMPVMDGWECCQRLKSELQTSHIPVMLLTACAQDEQRIAGFESGADSYISKPFSSKLLVARVKNLVANRQRLKQFFGDATSLAKEPVSEIDKDFVGRFRQLIEEQMADSNLSIESLGELKQFFGDATSLAKEPVSEIDKDFVGRFRQLIEEQMADSNLSIESLGEQLGMSRVQLYRKIKAMTNYTPVELLRVARLKRAASLLASTEKTVAEITYEVGFSSPSYFTKCYKEYFGESPTDFLKKKKG